MQTSRIAIISLLFGATAFGACRCGEPLQVLAPKIEIGDPYDATFSVCATDFIKDCAYDYGQVGIGRPKLFSFVIKNPTQVDLNIQSITIDGSPNFTVEGTVPDVVESATGAIGKMVTIKYAPQTETDETANVIIKSDAENLAQGEDVVIALTATGKDLGCPVLAVNPSQCDFGSVGVGAEGNCQLSLQNDGNQELEIDSIGFSSDTPADVFGAASVFPVPTFVQPGTAATVAFYARPSSVTQFNGTLIIGSNDCQNPSVNVPLVVQGASAPTAVARVKSINGVANSQQTPPVEPLDDVVLSGDQSVAQTGTIVSYQWNIVEQPTDSTVRLSNPTGVDTGFQFDSAAGVVSGLDVAGTFRISLVVTDSNGAQSANDATITLNAVPTEGLHVQLTWSASVDDIDLHLGRGNNPGWCSQDDCYYGDCTYSSLDWDGQPGQTAGDPSLDIDDLEGFGPENINIDQPANGSYEILVHAYSGNPNYSSFTATDLEVKIFVGGALVQAMTGHFNNTDDAWTVARVDVNGGTTVTPIDTMQTNFTCF